MPKSSETDARHSPRRHRPRVSTSSLAGASVVLVADLAGVTAVTATGFQLARAGDPARGVAVCALVAFTAWVLAVVAVVSAAKGVSSRSARRWVWVGLLLNSAGSLGIALAAAVAGGAEELATGGTPAPALVTALLVAVGGALVSAGYLWFLRRDAHPDPAPGERLAARID
ncbi:hypothetical protein [Herbiconiux sp. A18JL235]|uniref:Uncharacterized protein n=1 Tax=Herbiconiux sp. A18JL235 TaxID=3152363 RepID=A0AB39BGM1_9MICO